MNPVVYCAVASCSDKDWEVFGVILAIILIFGGVIGGISYLIETFRKDKNMK